MKKFVITCLLLLICASPTLAEEKQFITLPTLPEGLVWRVSESIVDVFTHETVITRKFTKDMANAYVDVIRKYVNAVDDEASAYLEIKIFQQSDQRAVAHILLYGSPFGVVDCQVARYKGYYVRTVSSYICDAR